MTRMFGRHDKTVEANAGGAVPAAKRDKVVADLDSFHRAFSRGHRLETVVVRTGALLKKIKLGGFTAEHGLGAIGIGIAAASSAFAFVMIAHNHQGPLEADGLAKRQPLNWTQISRFAKADIDPMATGSISATGNKTSGGLSGAGEGGIESDPSARKLPGYVLRDVFEGVALVEGGGGIRAVSPGFTLPEGSTVTAIERHAGKWVVVTTGGIIAEAR